MSKELIPKDVYVPVSVKDGLPEKDGFYYCMFEGGDEGNDWFKNGQWYTTGKKGYHQVIAWLKPIASQYVFDRKELELFMDMVWEAALDRKDWERESDGWSTEQPTLPDLIKQLLK